MSDLTNRDAPMKPRKTLPASKSASEAAVPIRVWPSTSTHDDGMRELVGVSMGIRQGDTFDAMRLDFELNCGTAYVSLYGGDFAVSMTTCFVGLHLENCRVKAKTHYEHRLSIGEVDSTLTETRDRQAGRDATIGVEARGDASPKRGVLGSLSLTGKAKVTGKADRSSKEVIKRRPRIDVIVAAGQDRWQVGDPHVGDARRADGRLLGSYFGEERDPDGDSRPLCTVVGNDAEAASAIIVSAVARVGQLIVELNGDAATSEQRGDVEAVLKKRSRKLVASHHRQAADLRRRVAGMVLAKAMVAAQDRQRLGDHEILMARQEIRVTPVQQRRSGGGK